MALIIYKACPQQENDYKTCLHSTPFKIPRFASIAFVECHDVYIIKFYFTSNYEDHIHLYSLSTVHSWSWSYAHVILFI